MQAVAEQGPRSRTPSAFTALLALSLAALLTGCNPDPGAEYDTGSSGGPTPTASDGPSGGSGAVPAGLVGEWQDPSDLVLGERNLDIYDPQTGWPEDPDAAKAGSGIRITRDGHYVWSSYLATHISGSACHSRALSYQRGSVRGGGSRLILEPEINHRGYQGGCNSDADMDREESHAAQTWTFTQQPDSNGVAHLVLTSGGITHDYVLVRKL